MPSKRRRRFSRTMRRGKKQFIWTTTIVEATQVSEASPLEALVLEPLDWNNAAAYLKGALVERVVGSFDVQPRANQTSSYDFGQWTALLVKQDTNLATLPDPSAASGYSEDVLQSWQGEWQLALSAVATLTWQRNMGAVHREVDVRSKRKMTTDDALWFIMSNEADSGTSASVLVTATLRVLLSLP